MLDFFPRAFLALHAPRISDKPLSRFFPAARCARTSPPAEGERDATMPSARALSSADAFPADSAALPHFLLLIANSNIYAGRYARAAFKAELILSLAATMRMQSAFATYGPLYIDKSYHRQLHELGRYEPRHAATPRDKRRARWKLSHGFAPSRRAAGGRRWPISSPTRAS